MLDFAMISAVRYAFRLLPAFATLLLAAGCAHTSDSRPNVLLLVVDDLNHWIGCLHRNPQARTPNIDQSEPRAPAKQKHRRHVKGPGAREEPPRPANIKLGTFEIGAPDIADSETEDCKVAKWGAWQLAQKHDRPFFLALGFIKPHPPWIVPKKYFDMFPLDSIQLPPHIANDLDDLPPAARKWAHD